MAYAPYTNDQRGNRPAILGAFREVEYGGTFEYSTRKNGDGNDPFGGWASADYPHMIWTGDRELRIARVLKTCAYVVIDEDDKGNPVVEKWTIRAHRGYLQ